MPRLKFNFLSAELEDRETGQVAGMVELYKDSVTYQVYLAHLLLAGVELKMTTIGK